MLTSVCFYIDESEQCYHGQFGGGIYIGWPKPCPGRDYNSRVWFLSLPLPIISRAAPAHGSFWRIQFFGAFRPFADEFDESQQYAAIAQQSQ